MSIFCYQHHIESWRRKTAHLPLEQRGAYRELMDWFYFTEGRLPAEEGNLFRMVGAQTISEKRSIRFVASTFFEPDDKGFLTQKRCEDELRNIKNRSEKASQNAMAKHNKNNDISPAVAEPPSNENDANYKLRTNNNKESISPTGIPTEALQGAVDLWNDFAKEFSLPQVQRLTDTRKKKLQARLREAGGIDGWKAALEQVRGAKWMYDGSSRNGWTASFDFLLQEAFFTKLMEGTYAKRGTGDGDKPQFKNGFLKFMHDQAAGSIE